MWELMMFPFRMLGSIIGFVFDMIGSIVGFVFGLAGGIFGLIFGGGFAILTIIGLIAIIRWAVRGARGA